MRVLRLFALVLVPAWLACSDSGGGLDTDPVTELFITGGNTQVGVAGQPLGTQLSVLAHDIDDEGVAGVTVTWSAASGGGSVNPTSSVTNASGIASTTRTLGANAGAHTTTATVTGLTPVTFNAVAQIQGATQIALSTGNNQSDTVLSALSEPLAVIVRDQNNAPVAGVVVNWTATGGGSVSAATSTTIASGIATISRTFGIAAGAQGAQATVTGLAGSPVAFTLTATPGNPVFLTQVSANVGTVPAGTMANLSVLVRDNHVNPVSGVTIDWINGGGGVSTVNPAQSTTNANGIAGTVWTLGTTHEAYYVNAVAPTLPGPPGVFFAADVATFVTVGGATNVFNPTSVTIPLNGKVVFSWAPGNTLLHNVTFTPAAGAPSDIPNQTTATLSALFGTAGTFTYQCTNHPGMNGSVTVTP